jgi:DNA recombination protein RmuC
MVAAMELGAVLVAILVAIVAGAVLGVALFAAARTRDDTGPAGPSADLELELRHLAEEQRRFGETLLHRLHEASASHLDHERRRATTELDGKKALIDQQLGAMTSELGKVGELVRGLDADRRSAFGELANELQRQHEGLNALSENTRQLREALASQKTRGQWGERMAEDVLRLSGFLEGVNYRRQATLAESGGRPDYTFLLPNGLVMHMDVKFPLDNYVRSLEAESELETRRFRDQFLRDVRDRVRELTTRGYLDDGTETVDCLLLFIPNEQVYAYVHEQDRSILDDALRHKIVLCSPLTLYAVLAVVRQAVDNFRLEKTSNEILALLGEFSLQWQKYVLQLEKVQQRFDAVGKEYAALMSTRHRALQRPLDKIEALRHEEPALTDTEIPPFAIEG